MHQQVWAIKPDEIHCVQVHNVKEAVLELAANAEFACFTSQGTGVKASACHILLRYEILKQRGL